MNEEIRKYINTLFEEAPKTKAAYELKEELITNSSERFIDVVESGIPEKEALHIVMESIGNIDQLFSAIDTNQKKPEETEELIKKKALFKTIAIGLYIFGFVLAIIMEEFFFTGYQSLGAICMLIMMAIATCLLVYQSTAYPKYKKTEDTVVEDFKEWIHNRNAHKEIRNSVYVIIWMITLVLYFVISFTTMAWYITWVMFLIGVCAQAIATLLFQLRSNR